MDTSLSAPFVNFSRQAVNEINAALDRYLQPRPGLPEGLRDAIRHSLLAPGKRLRPVLVLMAAKACGQPDRAAMPAACAVEMIHCYSLIHDDLPAMDDDDLRRGLPTCHAKYGEATAILAGDALIARAFEVLAKDIQDASACQRCLQVLGEAAGDAALVGGQFDDLSPETNEGGLEMLQHIHLRKTGALFRASVLMGGIVGGASQAKLDALEQYGGKLGLAFQVVDDLLDACSTTDDLGKRTQKDADRGKLTYPGLIGLEASRARAEQLIEEARAAVSVFGDQASEMESLAHFVLDRTR